METANAGRSISGNFEVTNDNEPNIHHPLSTDSLEKSPYEQDSPPICYVDLGGHKSSEAESHVRLACFCFKMSICHSYLCQF